MRTRIVSGIAAALIAASLAPAAIAGIKEGDVNVGVDGEGRLTLIFDGATVELPEINGPLYGFGLDEPGIISLENPVLGLDPPAPGANLVLQVDAFDPALKAGRPGSVRLSRIPATRGTCGPVPVHEHPFWQVDSTDAGYVPPPGQTEWNARFRIIDTGSTGYLPSDPVTVTFTPEPGSLALLAIGGGLAMCRRRR
jgi:hypothetical protein